MDKIKKALRKFFPKEKKELEKILIKIKSRQFDGLDIKKLKGQDDVFRIRKGSLRIIFQINPKNIKIQSIERKNDNTYKKL